MNEISDELGALLWRRYYLLRAESYGGQITVNDDTFRMLLDGAGIPEPEDDVVVTSSGRAWRGRELTIRPVRTAAGAGERGDTIRFLREFADRLESTPTMTATIMVEWNGGGLQLGSMRLAAPREKPDARLG